MTCKEAKGLVEAYADGELDLTSSLEVERHVAECKACAASLASHESLRSSLGGASLYFEAPPRLRSRVRAAVRKQVRAPAARWLTSWRWVAIAMPAASVAVLVVALLAISRTPSSRDLLSQEIVSAHVRSLMADHLTDFPSSDQHTVKPSFAGRLDFSPEVKDLSSEAFTLLGGRLDYVDRTPAAALVYQRRKHLINLFVWPSKEGSDARVVQASLRGYNVLTWTRSGMSYAAASDINSTELQEFQRAVSK